MSKRRRLCDEKATVPWLASLIGFSVPSKYAINLDECNDVYVHMPSWRSAFRNNLFRVKMLRFIITSCFWPVGGRRYKGAIMYWKIKKSWLPTKKLKCFVGGLKGPMTDSTKKFIVRKLQKVKLLSLTHTFGSLFKEARVPANRKARLEFLAERFVDGEGQETVTRMREESKAVEGLDEDMRMTYQTVVMQGTQIPMDVIEYIFAYLPHNHEGVLGVGSVCVMWYYCYLKTWDTVRFRMSDVKKIPLLVLKHAKTFRVTFEKLKHPDSVRWFAKYAHPTTLEASGETHSFVYALKQWKTCLARCETLKASTFMKFGIGPEIDLIPPSVRHIEGLCSRGDDLQVLQIQCPSLKSLDHKSFPEYIPVSCDTVTCQFLEGCLGRAMTLSTVPDNVTTLVVKRLTDWRCLDAILPGSNVRYLHITLLSYVFYEYRPYLVIPSVKLLVFSIDCVILRSVNILNLLRPIFPSLQTLWLTIYDFPTKYALSFFRSFRQYCETCKDVECSIFNKLLLRYDKSESLFVARPSHDWKNMWLTSIPPTVNTLRVIYEQRNFHPEDKMTPDVMTRRILEPVVDVSYIPFNSFVLRREPREEKGSCVIVFELQ